MTNRSFFVLLILMALGRSASSQDIQRLDSVLDDIDDIDLHDLRSRVVQAKPYIDNREVDIRHLADAHATKSYDSEQDKGGHEHPREHGSSD